MMKIFILILTFGFIPIFHTFLHSFFEIEHTRTLLLYLAVLLAIASALPRILSSKEKINLNFLDVLVLLFLLIFTISTAISKNLLASIFGAPIDLPQGHLLFTISLVVMYFYYKSISGLKTITISILISLTSITWLIIFSLFIDKGNTSFFNGFPIRVMAQDNSPISLANYLMFGLPLAIVLLFSSSNRLVKILAAIFLIFDFFSIVLSLTRSVWIASFFQIIILGSLSIYFKLIPPRQLWLNKIFVVISICLVSSAIYFFPLVANKISSTVTDDPVYNSVNIRTLEFKSGLKIIKGYPFLGAGPDSIAYIGNQYRSQELNKNEKEGTWPLLFIRNYYLQLGASIGLFGLAIFMAINIYFVTRFLRFLSTSVNSKENIITVGLFCAWLSLSIHYFLYAGTTISQILFWQSLGLLAGIISKKNNLILVNFHIKISKTIAISSFLLFSAVLIPICIVIFKDIQSQMYYKKSIGNKDFIERLSVVKNSLDLNPYNIKYQRRYIGINTVLIVNAMTENNPDNLPIDQMIIDGQTHLNYAIKLDSLNPDIVLEQAFLSNIKYMKAKNDKKTDRTLEFNTAEADAKFAISLDPTNPLALDTLTSIYLDADGKKLKEAEQFARKTIEVKYSYIHAHHHLGEALKQQGRFDEAIEAYEQTFLFKPGDPISKREIEEIKKLIN